MMHKILCQSVRHYGSEIGYHLVGYKCILGVFQLVKKALDLPLHPNLHSSKLNWFSIWFSNP